MNGEITAEQKASCAADGAVVLRNVISEEWLNVVEAGIERDIQNLSLIHI